MLVDCTDSALVLGIETHDAIPDRVDQGRRRHRCAGVSRLSLPDSFYRKDADDDRWRFPLAWTIPDSPGDLLELPVASDKGVRCTVMAEPWVPLGSPVPG